MATFGLEGLSLAEASGLQQKEATYHATASSHNCSPKISLRCFFVAGFHDGVIC